jgi:glutamate-1-semialdehyde 2,1-aminomutase
MKVADRPIGLDQRLLQELTKFVPAEVFDAHAHLVMPAANLPPHLDGQRFGLNEYRRMVGSWLPGRQTGALVFGFPSRDNDRGAINRWIGEEIAQAEGPGLFRGLVLTAPQDDPGQVEALLRGGVFVGIKPYHLYAPMADTRQAAIEAFAPEWMWDLCHAHDGLLMLHIMRDRAISDEANLTALARLTRRYPRCRLILAHVGRSFSYRQAGGLAALVDLGNVWVDTSAITERETLRLAAETLGADRILFGTDFPISNLRGRCVATGEFFTWVYTEKEPPATEADNPGQMTLIGIESLMCLREAAEDCALSPSEVTAIFSGNARRLLADRRTNSSPAGSAV